MFEPLNNYYSFRLKNKNLLVQKFGSVDTTRLDFVLGQLDLVDTQLAGQRYGQLLHVHGEIVELEAFVKDASYLSYFYNFHGQLGRIGIFHWKLIYGIVKIVWVLFEFVFLLALNYFQLVAHFFFQISDPVFNVKLRGPEKYLKLKSKLLIIVFFLDLS